VRHVDLHRADLGQHCLGPDTVAGIATIASHRIMLVVPARIGAPVTGYDAIHRGIVAHPVHVVASNIDELRAAQFVFVAIDTGPHKRFILEKLQGVRRAVRGHRHGDLPDRRFPGRDDPGNCQRSGQYRAYNGRVSDIFGEEEDDEYEQNIQVAELNMLNAALAVIKFKKLLRSIFQFNLHAFPPPPKLDTCRKQRLPNGLTTAADMLSYAHE
jgi:hypothetical protein